MYNLAKIPLLLFLKLKMQIFPKKFLVSYNVTSLFTNIPFQETIDIAVNLIFNHNPNLNINKFYNKIDGVAMGSPLASVLANIFMGFHESKWLNEYNLNKPKFYLRHVEEKQINHSIAFLDVFISGINNQNLKLQTYHKSTYTGLLLDFKSFTSFSYKISLIKCLIDRSFKICNNGNSFHNDIENIKSNLIKNAYPLFLIDEVIKKYLDYKFSTN